MSGKLIVCAGGSGSPGITTVAAQMSYAFSANTGLDAALVDIDLDGSPLAPMTEVNDTGAMSKLYELAAVGPLGDEVISMAMQSASDHLKVVTGFRGTEMGPGCRVAQVMRAINGVNSRVDVTILDMGRPRFWNAFDILKDVDVICWVVTPTPEGAYAWRRVWSTFDGRGLPKSRMVAVLNQFDHPRALANFPEHWMENPGIPLVAKIPYLPKLDPIDLTRPARGKLGKKSASWLTAYESFVSRVAGSLPLYDYKDGGGALRGLLGRNRNGGA